GAQARDQDAGPVLHMERDLFDTFRAALILGADDQPMRAVGQCARVQGQRRRQFPADDRLRLVVQEDPNVWFGHGQYLQRSGRRMSYLAWCGSFSPGRKIIQNIATKQPVVMMPATDATATMPHNGPISMCCMASLLRALAACGGHPGRRHRPGMVAPGTALVID